jgi:hypothetical protein
LNDDFYREMRAVAGEVLWEFKQGAIIYKEAGPYTGPAWNPTPGADVISVLDATASGVSAEYVDGKSVLATDLMVTAAVFDRVPTMSGRLEIDGKEVQIVKIMAKPAAGTVVVWSFICRA